jgi:hypothetical protein
MHSGLVPSGGAATAGGAFEPATKTFTIGSGVLIWAIIFTMSSGQGGRRVNHTRVVKNAHKTSFTSIAAAINVFRLV